MLNITHYQRNANQNHYEVPFQNLHFKDPQMILHDSYGLLRCPSGKESAFKQERRVQSQGREDSLE